MPSTRILLADDPAMFVDCLARILEFESPDLQVVAVAHDGAEAVGLARRTRPDLVLMGVRLRKVGGNEAARQIYDVHPEAAVIMLASREDRTMVRTAVANGALGYVLKSASVVELLAAIQNARLGKEFFSNNVYLKGDGARPTPTASLKALTRSEKRVYTLVTRGFDNRSIARAINLGEQTVKNYVSSIYTKIGVHDRVQAVKKASAIL